MNKPEPMQGLTGTISGIGVSRMEDGTPRGNPLYSTVEMFERAVRDHSRRLHAIARAIVGNRASPEDVVQQAVMNLFHHRERYDWREPGGLLKRATVNEALRLLRRPKMAQVADESYLPDADGDAPDAAMEQSETTRRVREAIDNLPENFRAALVLCEYEEMPYAEIATTLGATVPQVKTWIFRARRKLETQLRGYYDGVRPRSNPLDEVDSQDNR